MKPFKHLDHSIARKIQYVLTDIDDTLTTDGRLPAVALFAIERLRAANIHVVPITGRPAGWCDHIARMWPVNGVVGENGAFYFYYDHENKKMIRRYWKSKAGRRQDKEKLEAIKEKIIIDIPGCRVSADQPFREADLAIDFCEDVPPLPARDIEKIVHIFKTYGATAKISSIHVNGWFGNYDKLSMTRLLFSEVFQVNLDHAGEQVIFVGDSPNDAPMFEFFENSTGVANVVQFAGKMASEPIWVTEEKGGRGFAEMVEILLSKRVEK